MKAVNWKANRTLANSIRYDAKHDYDRGEKESEQPQVLVEYCCPEFVLVKGHNLPARMVSREPFNEPGDNYSCHEGADCVREVIHSACTVWRTLARPM